MRVNVTSEFGRLREVLVHEPGLEVDYMVPDTMDELLFDDLIFGTKAREEHGIFRTVLEKMGVRTVEALDLLTESLAVPEAREWVGEILEHEVGPHLHERFTQLEPAELAAVITQGVRLDSGGIATPAGSGTLADDVFSVLPIPNWCFQRDPQVVIGNGVVFCAMASPARHREALISRTIFWFHPELALVPVHHDPLEFRAHHHVFLERQLPRIEGGDLQVLSHDVIALGQSERTNSTAMKALARSLARLENGPRWLFLVELPRKRAYMHLDTVFSPINHDACLIYPPVIAADGHERTGVAEIDLRSSDLRPRAVGDFLSALKKRGLDWEPIPCGGQDPLQQQREQWTDGANSLSIGPGQIVLYARNVGTAEELSRRGYRVLEGEKVATGWEAIDPDSDEKLCVLIPSHEISRARGGPHCLTHPLLREDVG